MPTDDERREVAARLRRLSGHREVDKEFVHEALGLYMGECVDGYDPVSVSKLADLIEPEEWTCRLAYDMVNDDMVCSSCGARLDMIAYSELETLGQMRYCPVCGAKVVDDHA